jgi:hypothetical protein
MTDRGVMVSPSCSLHPYSSEEIEEVGKDRQSVRREKHAESVPQGFAFKPSSSKDLHGGSGTRARAKCGSR